MSDLKLAFRTLRRSPGFTIPALLTLALGIGANTAMFSIIDALMLRPLPFRDPNRLALVWQSWDDLPSLRGMKSVISDDQIERWRELSRSFDSIGGYSTSRVSATGAGGPERVQAAQVSGDLMRVLAYEPILGRSFQPAELRKGAAGVAILGHAYWQRTFGGQRSALGRTISLDGQPYTIIGVLPPSAQPVLPHAMRTVDVWTPAHLSLMSRLNGFVLCTGVGRMKPGVSVAQANTELKSIHERIRGEKRSWKGKSVGVSPLRDEVASSLRTALLVLFGAVVCVLLIGTVNIANLQLARTAARRRETGIRAVLGGGRARLLRQSLAESAVAGLAGGLLGVMFSQWMLKGILALWPVSLEQFGEVRLDWPVLLFGFGVSLATGLLFGLLPAWQASRSDLSVVIKDAGTQGKRRRGAFSPANLLVASEVALAVVLLIGAGLLVRTFSLMRGVDPGFRTEHAIVFSLPMVDARYKQPAAIGAFSDNLLQRLHADPRIESAAMTNTLPLRGGFVVSVHFSIVGRTLPDDASAGLRAVTPGYFRTMGLALRKGRYLNGGDKEAMLINGTAARRFFGRDDPLGARVNPGIWKGIEIVGVVADVKNSGLADQTEPEFYMPLNMAGGTWVDLVVRSRQDPKPVIAAVRKELLAADPNLAPESIRSIREIVAGDTAQPRFRATLLGTFAALAAVLAAVGIFGVISYSVTQRTREFGVRMALGAERRDVLGMVVRQGVVCAGAGVVLGLAGAAAAVRVLRSMLFGVTVYDPATFAGVAALVLAIAALAAWIPARRATRVDPMVALRYE